MPKIGSQKTCKAFDNNYKRCNTIFRVNHPKQKFCSDKCRKRNNRKIKERETKKREKEDLRIEKNNEKFKSRIGRAERIYDEIMELSTAIIYYQTPISIPKNKSISDFRESSSFYEYSTNKTRLEREEKKRKDMKKVRIKEFREKVFTHINTIININSFIPESDKRGKNKIKKFMSNLNEMQNDVGEISRKISTEVSKQNDFKNVIDWLNER